MVKSKQLIFIPFVSISKQLMLLYWLNFNDFSGVVEEIDQEKNKVKVAVMIFGRSTPVELDFSQIERS